MSTTNEIIFLVADSKGEHHITIPLHSPLRVGTLNNILNDVATHLQFDRNELLRRLVG